jgi:predicted Kef-type K+ transport protein
LRRRWLAGFLAWRLRQPILLGYVLAGLLLSPLTPGPRVHDVNNFETVADSLITILANATIIRFLKPAGENQLVTLFDPAEAPAPA